MRTTYLDVDMLECEISIGPRFFDVSGDLADVLSDELVLFFHSQVIASGEAVDERIANFDDDVLDVRKDFQGEGVWHVFLMTVTVHPVEHALRSVGDDVNFSDRLLLYWKEVAGPVEGFFPGEFEGIGREWDESCLGVNLATDLQQRV